MLRFEDLRVRDSQALDRDFFNRRFRLIAENVAQLETDLAAIGEATDRLVQLGLNRVNEVLGPALEQAQAAAESGFLVATSSSALTLAVGLETTLVVDDTPARALFTPTPYVLISREAEDTVNDWAILRVQEYDRETGGLAFECLAVNGDVGAASHNDWVISATAGLAVSIMEAAVAVEQTLSLAQEAAATAEAAAATATAVLANGPVSSVNGKTGTVTLVMGDIAGLIAALGGKADTAHGHTIAQISNLQSTLNGLQAQIDAIDGGTY